MFIYFVQFLHFLFNQNTFYFIFVDTKQDKQTAILPKFSADAFASNIVRCIVRALAGAVVVIGGLLLPAGECND